MHVIRTERLCGLHLSSYLKQFAVRDCDSKSRSTTTQRGKHLANLFMYNGKRGESGVRLIVRHARLVLCIPRCGVHRVHTVWCVQSQLGQTSCVQTECAKSCMYVDGTGLCSFGMDEEYHIADSSFSIERSCSLTSL